MSIGGGKSSGSQSDPAASTLARIAEQFAIETTPLRQGLIGQLQETLTTGKPTGAQIPIISQAVEATRRAASTAQRGTEEELARTNLVGTPFGQNILAEGRREGEMVPKQTATDIMKTLYNLVPNFVLGQSQTALSGLSGAVGGNVSGKGKGFGAGASK